MRKQCTDERLQSPIPELERPENAKWLALLIDTEGSLGWSRQIMRRDRINGYRYRYVHRYGIPYLSAEMNELESGRIVEEGARLINVGTRKRIRRGVAYRYFAVSVGKAITIMRYIKPYLVKFERLANLCLTIFKHRTYIPLDQFNRIGTDLFGAPITSKQANEILLAMPREEYIRLLTLAQNLAPT